jgi:peptidoglycan/LPS O-acetylase OafA/YrhL
MSIVLTSFGLDEYNKATITPYLNPLNWMLYFSLGVLIHKYKLLERIAIFARKIIIISSTALVLDVFLHIKFDLSYSYWSSFAIVNILIALFVIFGLASILLDRKAFLLVSIGRLSFSIYLLHELIVGLIIYFSSKYDIWVGTLARPFIVILLVMTGIYSYTYFARKLKCEKTALLLIGTKPQKQQKIK